MNRTKQIVRRTLKRQWHWAWKTAYKRFFEGKEYVVAVPDGVQVYTPWLHTNADNEFNRISAVVLRGGPSSQPASKRYFLYSFVKYATNLDGNMAECGVAFAGTTHLIAETIAVNASPPCNLDLFDTFSGYPKLDHQAKFDTKKAYVGASLEVVQQRLQNYAEFCRYFPGIIPESFEVVTSGDHYSLVNIDVDLYPTTRACCEWFWPRLTPGGVMIINDYGNRPYRYDARRAADEFFAEINVSLIVLPTGQAFAIKSR